jgi:hypothetical protein
MKLGQLYVQNKNLQFIPEAFNELTKKSVKINNRRGDLKERLAPTQSLLPEAF